LLQVAVEGALVEAFAAAGAWFGGAPHTVVGPAFELAFARNPALLGFRCLARGFHCAAGLDLAAWVRGRAAPCLQVRAALEMAPCEGSAVAVRRALGLLATATSAAHGEYPAAAGFCLDPAAFASLVAELAKDSGAAPRAWRPEALAAMQLLAEAHVRRVCAGAQAAAATAAAEAATASVPVPAARIKAAAAAAGVRLAQPFTRGGASAHELGAAVLSVLRGAESDGADAPKAQAAVVTVAMLEDLARTAGA
jgi:hypothetical protein